MEFKDSYLGATFHIQWFCRSSEPWMRSRFGPLGKATKSCCLKGSREETSAWRNFSCSPGSHPPSQHQPNIRNPSWSSLVSARLDGDSSDPASHTTPDLCQHQILQEAQGKHWLQWVCLQIPPCQSCPHVPTSTACCCCRMFQEPPPQSRQRGTMSQWQHWRTGLRQSAQSSESLLSLHRRLLWI